MNFQNFIKKEENNINERLNNSGYSSSTIELNDNMNEKLDLQEIFDKNYDLVYNDPTNMIKKTEILNTFNYLLFELKSKTLNLNNLKKRAKFYYSIYYDINFKPNNKLSNMIKNENYQKYKKNKKYRYCQEFSNINYKGEEKSIFKIGYENDNNNEKVINNNLSNNLTPNNNNDNLNHINHISQNTKSGKHNDNYNIKKQNNDDYYYDSEKSNEIIIDTINLGSSSSSQISNKNNFNNYNNNKIVKNAYLNNNKNFLLTKKRKNNENKNDMDALNNNYNYNNSNEIHDNNIHKYNSSPNNEINYASHNRPSQIPLQKNDNLQSNINIHNNYNIERIKKEKNESENNNINYNESISPIINNSKYTVIKPSKELLKKKLNDIEFHNFLKEMKDYLLRIMDEKRKILFLDKVIPESREKIRNLFTSQYKIISPNTRIPIYRNDYLELSIIFKNNGNFSKQILYIKE